MFKKSFRKVLVSCRELLQQIIIVHYITGLEPLLSNAFVHILPGLEPLPSSNSYLLAYLPFSLQPSGFSLKKQPPSNGQRLHLLGPGKRERQGLD